MNGIIRFFKDLFASLFGKKKKTANTPVSSTPGNTDEASLPSVDTSLPQDGAESKPDSVLSEIKIILPEVPVIVDETPEVTEETPPVTTPVPAEIPTTTGSPEKHRYLWCLDNGHGKKTPGKRSPKLEDGSQLLEYEFNRDIVKRIAKALDEKDIKYFITVPEVDIDDFLQGRVGRANNKQSSLTKIFVSVHANAAPTPAPGQWAEGASGIETWFNNGSKRGEKVAAIFQRHLIEKTGFKNRNIKGGGFYVLRNTNMTAVLTENGFYTHKEETQKLMTDKYRQKIADAHVAAIAEIEKNGI